MLSYIYANENRFPYLREKREMLIFVSCDNTQLKEL